MRLFFRMPLVLYRIGLGSLMSMQMLLTTVGRKSGQPHRVVVDIIGHDKTRDTYYVSAAFGPRSDWYLNLKANPTAHAQVGRRKFTARATTLPDAEDVFVKFVLRHPCYVRVVFNLVGAIMRVVGDRLASLVLRISWSEDEVRALASQMPVVAIQPETR